MVTTPETKKIIILLALKQNNRLFPVMLCVDKCLVNNVFIVNGTFVSLSYMLIIKTGKDIDRVRES